MALLIVAIAALLLGQAPTVPYLRRPRSGVVAGASCSTLPSGAAYSYEARLGNNCSSLACNNGDTISPWLDQSGNANNLAIHAGDAGAVYNTNQFGTTPGATFNGSSRSYDFGSAVNFQTASTACVVLKNISTAAKGTYLSGPTNSFAHWTSSGTPEQGADKTGSSVLGNGTAAKDTSAHLLCATYDGTTVSFYLDGAADGSAAPSVAISANETQIGRNASNSAEYINAVIGGAWGWTSVLSSANLSCMHGYATGNFGTP